MMLTSILLDENITSDYKTTNDNNALSNLSKINIFIGANNSGKSRLMRSIFANDKFLYLREGINSSEITEFINRYHDALVIGSSRVSNNVKSIPKLLNLRGYLSFNEGTNLSKWFNFAQNSLRFNALNHSDKDIQIDMHISYFDFAAYNKEFQELENRIKSENTVYNKIYVPILRGLRPIQIGGSNGKTFGQGNSYLDRTVFDYFKEYKEPEKLSISTGLDFYDQLTHLILGNPNEQELVKDFESFLSKTFFQNETITITPHSKKDVVTFRVGQGEAHPIYDLGDGIQAIILLTYPLFFNKDKDMIFFFEEPEIYLHPGFQRIFINTLLDKRFSSFQYFFSTHSNHFLDITLDHDNISIFNFRKDKTDKSKFFIENVQSGDNSLLEELGVRNASVFLSNCTIWVEGISDRIYIRKYLEVYIQKQLDDAKLKGNTEGVSFREDYHYSFVEYSGNNITHWSFLENDDDDHPNINVESICKRIFLVTDQDGAGKISDDGKKVKVAKQERQEKLRTKLGEDNYHCLDCREIENALSPEILKKAIESRKKKGKENEDIIYKRTWDDKYQDKKLGDYIMKNIEAESIEILNKINENGTIYNKVDFAKSAVAAIRSYDDLSQSAKVLMKKIYAFIKKSNE